VEFRGISLILTAPEQNLSGQTMGSKGLRTRRKLIDATVGLLETTPLRDLKVVDITQAAQTSTATFYVYFDSVIEVVLAATAELSQSTPEILALASRPWDAATSDERALALVTTYIGFWDAHRPLFRTRNLAAEEGDERFIRTREDSVRPLIAALVEQIELGRKAGRVPGAVIPYATVGTMLMMLERLGALGHIYDRNEHVTYAELVQAAAHMVSIALGWPIGNGTTADHAAVKTVAR
jgi:AcrR family transcriptional regulator